MIRVRNLTKFYGDHPAVVDLSFDADIGQVVAFLGPNGAGKTTTLRILAGYLTATSGTASVDGVDVFEKPIEARRRIGYLPENCPLPPELRVDEYLSFRAGIKGVFGRKRRSQVAEALDRCKITDVSRQVIGTLSKGYRQRVGLADVLLADPPVLLLDEPAASLDPSQVRETRALIRELGHKHTVLLSTHLLTEVEQTCDHIVIISRGRLVAAGTLSKLTREAGETAVVHAVFAGRIKAAPLRKLAGATRVEGHASDVSTKLRVFTRDPDGLAPQLCEMAYQQGWRLLEVTPRRQTLEDLFVHLTGGRVEPDAPPVGDPVDVHADDPADSPSPVSTED